MSRRIDRLLLALAAILLALPAGVAAADPPSPGVDRSMASMHGAMRSAARAEGAAACIAMHGSMASMMSGATMSRGMDR